MPKKPASFFSPAKARVENENALLDRDIFVNYIADKVNPARLKEGLACISMTAASVCHDVLTSRRYRQ